MKTVNKNNKIYVTIIVMLVMTIVVAFFIDFKQKDGKFELPKIQTEPITKTDFALDTYVTITIYDKNADEEVLDTAMRICHDYEDVFSTTKINSMLYQMNHRDGLNYEPNYYDGMPGTKDQEGIKSYFNRYYHELVSVIEDAVHYSELSDGAYDITIKPVKDLWDFHADNPKLPDENKLKSALEKVDYHNIVIDKMQPYVPPLSSSGIPGYVDIVSFKSEDTQIDLGSIAKGYIADQIKEYLVNQGVQSAVINLGGNVLCVGEKPDGEAFTIGLEKPYSDRSETVETLAINDMSVVSSGVYERCFDLDGVHYHHILNPKTGYPYQNGLLQVSIVCASSEEADVLSTTCFAMGLDEGMKLINSMDGVYAFFVTDDYEVHMSEGAEKLIKP